MDRLLKHWYDFGDGAIKEFMQSVHLDIHMSSMKGLCNDAKMAKVVIEFQHSSSKVLSVVVSLKKVELSILACTKNKACLLC